MSIDYFSLDGQPKVDKSDWFASISCLSGCLNGTPASYSINIQRETFLLQSERKNLWSHIMTLPADIASNGVKVLSYVQNLMTPGGTLDTEQETVSKVFCGLKSKNDRQLNSSRLNDDVLY